MDGSRAAIFDLTGASQALVSDELVRGCLPEALLVLGGASGFKGIAEALGTASLLGASKPDARPAAHALLPHNFLFSSCGFTLVPQFPVL